MKKVYLFGIVLSLLLIPTTTLVYAHGGDEEASSSDNSYRMDEMHKEVMEYIDDPELAKEMEDMHNSCEGSYKSASISSMNGNMMSRGMM